GADEAGEAKPAKGEQRKGLRPATKKERPAKRIEPWQVISGVAVLALVGYLVYSEISRDRPPSFSSGPPASGPPLNAPLLNSAPAGIDLAPLERAVAAAPNDAAALLRLANALHDNAMLPRAIDTYKKYLTIRAKDPDARTDLGICYFQMAQIDTVNAFALLQSAAQEMTRAHQDAPSHQPSAFNLGVVYLHMGKLEESNKWFKEAVALNKDSDLGRRAQNILSQHSLPQ
ncbi:MAG: tetratricopeptide repeat protein, partial [Bacteroidota bacterium]